VTNLIEPSDGTAIEAPNFMKKAEQKIKNLKGSYRARGKVSREVREGRRKEFYQLLT